jgi:hypothetical protein
MYANLGPGREIALDAQVGNLLYSHDYVARRRLASRGTMNQYAYCEGNPLSLADPLGLWAEFPEAKPIVDDVLKDFDLLLDIPQPPRSFTKTFPDIPSGLHEVLEEGRPTTYDPPLRLEGRCTPEGARRAYLSTTERTVVTYELVDVPCELPILERDRPPFRRSGVIGAKQCEREVRIHFSCDTRYSLRCRHGVWFIEKVESGNRARRWAGPSIGRGPPLRCGRCMPRLGPHPVIQPPDPVMIG